MMKLVTSPPTIGAAMRFIESAPVPTRNCHLVPESAPRVQLDLSETVIGLTLGFGSSLDRERIVPDELKMTPFHSAPYALTTSAKYGVLAP